MKKNQLMIFGLAGFLAVSLAFNVFFAVSSWNTPRVGKICGDADIEKINSILKSEDFSADKVKEFADEIAERSNNRKDANCVAISLISNQMQDNIDDFKTDVATLKDLDEKGANPSSKLDVTYSFKELESFTESGESSEGGRG